MASNPGLWQDIPASGASPAPGDSARALFPPQGDAAGVERLFERRTNSAPAAAAAASLGEVRAP